MASKRWLNIRMYHTIIRGWFDKLLLAIWPFLLDIWYLKIDAFSRFDYIFHDFTIITVTKIYRYRFFQEILLQISSLLKFWSIFTFFLNFWSNLTFNVFCANNPNNTLPRCAHVEKISSIAFQISTILIYLEPSLISDLIFGPSSNKLKNTRILFDFRMLHRVCHLFVFQVCEFDYAEILCAYMPSLNLIVRISSRCPKRKFYSTFFKRSHTPIASPNGILLNEFYVKRLLGFFAKNWSFLRFEVF